MLLKPFLLSHTIKALIFSMTCAPLLLSPTAFASSTPTSSEKASVTIYNWAAQIGKDTLSDFQRVTGIIPHYDVYDSNEALETKLIIGNSGFDVVSPSDSFLARQIESEIYQPLDRSRLSNWDNLDPTLLAAMEMHDPGNQYAIPYVFMTTGIGYNVEMVKERLGEEAPVDSWELIFNPTYLKKLSDCGVSFLDAPSEVLASALRYLGKDVNSAEPADYDAAYDLLAQVRPYIRYFHSFRYIDDLANGNLCVVLGWSGDTLQARDRANDSGNGQQIAYSIPKEGALVFFDTFAIPADAPHPDQAYAFLNFILRPEIAAQVSNDLNVASANQAANERFVLDEVRNNPAIYPTEAVMPNLFSLSVKSLDIDDKISETWARLISKK